MQEDVAESLAQVTFCPHGCIPREYYIDNGGEYSWLPEAMVRLSNAAAIEFGVTLADPYKSQSKGLIEGTFGNMEYTIFKGIDGWIGGDRTNKKTERRGKVVAPYRKGLAQLNADLQAGAAIYNNRPQNPAGRLRGLSPLQMLESKIAATGFVARVPSEEVFDLVFSRQEVRTVRHGVVTITTKGQRRTYEGDCLDLIPTGDTVEVLIPMRKGKARAYIKHRGQDLG